jgi:hypothetical protein
MHFILPDGFQIQFFRAGVEKFCEFGDVMDVTSLCGGREATQLHVLDKPLFERCHSSLLQIGIRLLGITVSSLAETSRPLLLAPADRPLLWCGNEKYREAV